MKTSDSLSNVDILNIEIRDSTTPILERRPEEVVDIEIEPGINVDIDVN